MNKIEKIIEFAEKHGATIDRTKKAKQKKSEINTTAKQRDLVIEIATDLGYLE